MDPVQTILIVEDEAITGISQARTLEHEGYNVIHVLSGEEAIDLFRSHEQTIDLILMDIDLGGGMDGTEAAREILKVYDVPVLFLSSHTEKEIVEKTEKITSYGYVVKNSGITVLAASIKMAFKLHEAHRNIGEHKQEIEAAYEELQATNEQLEAANAELMLFQRELMERERILKESETHYRLLAENMDDVVWVMGNDFRFTYISPSIRKLRGIDPEEAMEESPTDTFPHESLPQLFQAYGKGLQAMTDGHIQDCRVEVEQYRKDGSTVWVEILFKVLRDDRGEQIGFMGVSRDISARKKLENVLKENEERYRQLVDNAGEAIVVAQDNRLKFTNPMASTLTGFTGEELQSRPFIEFVHPNDRALVASRHAARFTGGESPPVYQFRLLNKDGGYRWIEINVVGFM
ncbi:MAG: PAS domain S-box protein [Spirochaetes bacterium]|nr:PAS domain S-box protein [Spirochaetota bacterium]